ncbi:FMN-binding negative transcriptional regulator [Nocardioides ganghwensis]|jgi:transcriptional regulator|uniref:FMN-binding negative transcriptional regulator n=1 Tax=Nocardioides ganghwensis TaxID=252230 RepID=A0A4V1RMP2_9ACTN|nr:FMN-binding negative transcriptional regulator [Nocardioides ganghwensis]MBD3946584.1 FMN-binding negative transcriptional regulator [Nocardioides ganghwensis]RYC03047.1 FMN-binding negative transcriptional regulator [Nocardioides ganghwensis]
MPDPQLYVPRLNVMDPDDVRPFVAAVGTAQLVTVGEDGTPDATFLPVLWEGDRLVGHLARANAHWRRIVGGSPALAIVTGPDTYVSPSWYATKAEHGRVVPTWNYTVVHLRGAVTVHDDAEWVRGLVTRLTEHHEQPRDDPWAVTDAPADYVEKNLRPIVGVEVVVGSVEAKAKLSQNRSDEDRAGVAAGLVADGRDPDGLVAP